MAHDPREELDGVGLDDELVVLGAELLGDRRANGSSLKRSSSKPIENVLTGSRGSSAIAATTADESTPPERKAPSGTSAIIRRRTAARIASRISSCSSSAVATVRLRE